MITVEDLYREDNPGKIVSISGGKELRGPCPDPGCGGTDRFGVFPRQNDGKGSYYCGRGSLGGNGCGKGGDVIQYLRDFRGMSYKDACGLLGIEPKGGGGSHYRYFSPKPRKRNNQQAFQPETKSHPEEVVDPAKWREHGTKFVEACHQALLQRPQSIAYLMARGITMEAIHKYRLGFHHGETRGNKTYQPSFRPWPSWGLADEKNSKGKVRKLILPAGLVIPDMNGDTLRCITIRLIKLDPQQPSKKYHYVKGSIRGTWLSNPGARAFVVQEGMFDCIAVDAAAGDLVGTIGLGTTGTKPDTRAATALKNSVCILGSLDFEKSWNKQKQQYESPGGVAGIWWSKNYPQYQRWPVPAGKDAGEAFGEGINLRDWILAGLPDSLLPGETKVDPVATEQPKPETEESIPETVDTILSSSPEDIKELKSLLTDADGFIRIYDHGNGLGPEINPTWSNRYPERRRRISELLFSSESVGHMIENLADGMYSPINLPG